MFCISVEENVPVNSQLLMFETEDIPAEIMIKFEEDEL